MTLPPLLHRILTETPALKRSFLVGGCVRDGLLGRAVKDFDIEVREWSDQIVFLHKIVESGADKSYGIQVARLAGMPKPVTDRAKEILRVPEEAELNLQRALDGEKDSGSQIPEQWKRSAIGPSAAP